MQNINNNISNLLLNQETLSNDFGLFSKIYLMTTENIKGYLERCHLEDKSVLTVAGSGDHVLNSYLMGARNVVCFDINPLAFYQVSLKRAAVITLSLDEFVDFFINKETLLDYSLFNKIEKELDDEVIELFEMLYSRYSNSEIFHKIYYRFHYSLTTLNKMQKLNSYLQEDDYKKLAGILKNKKPTFVQTNVTELRDKFDNQRFDLILLSNISESIENIYDSDYLKNYKRLIHSLSKLLNKNGMIQTGYIYNYYASQRKNIFSQNSKRKEVFTSLEFDTYLVDAYAMGAGYDGVIVYHKKK